VLTLTVYCSTTVPPRPKTDRTLIGSHMSVRGNHRCAALMNGRVCVIAFGTALAPTDLSIRYVDEVIAHFRVLLKLETHFLLKY